MKLYFSCLLFILVYAVPVFAASIEEFLPAKTSRECPNKIIETKTIEGIYTGWHKQRIKTITIQVEEEKEPVYIVASYDEAKKFFGERVGKPFSVTYKVRQSWWDYEKRCSQFKILVGAKQIPALKKSTPPREEEISVTSDTPDQPKANPEN